VADDRFDAVVVGAGPAGSVAALVLARGGARVALVDKARFPRDKACGDVVGPRGVRLLEDLGVALPGARRVGDMVVTGPSRRAVRLPCFPGRTYPGHGLALPRRQLDALLRQAALAAGAEPVTGRAGEPLVGLRGLEGFALDGGRRVRGDVVIGADGATSRVADAAGLVDPGRVLWGFALRCYLDTDVPLPHIVLWEPSGGRLFPGYGWLFPGPDGRANAGLGIGTLADRRAGAQAARLLPEFLVDLGRLGYLGDAGVPDDRAAGGPPERLGGWLKMGMVGTRPAAGRVLLVGDAAGLVNPLQGEGIAPAMTSARAAAEAVLAGPSGAAARYWAALGRDHLRFHRVAAAAHGALVGRPRAAAAAGRFLTLPVVGPALAGGWSLYWNELLDGAVPGPARATARSAASLGRLVTAPLAPARWLTRAYGPASPPVA